MQPDNIEKIVIDPFTPVLGYGGQGVVYGVSDDAVAKVYHLNGPITRILAGGEDPERVAMREYYIQKMLHQAGFPVPEPYGVEEVTLIRPSSLFGLYKPDRTALIAERINGVKGNALSGENLERALHLFDKWLKEAWKLEFTGIDARLEDTIYVPSENKLYFVDFGMWSHPSVYSL
ncbi:hypothetical protein D6764_00885 [Candidatus Woesearchaeota archaeon]|nr:MAG: hypothetical protein D6764_00885 [Candidatus Woesearchaeota archaeon]